MLLAHRIDACQDLVKETKLAKLPQTMRSNKISVNFWYCIKIYKITIKQDLQYQNEDSSNKKKNERRSFLRNRCIN
jgi:hypothetical protein